MKHCISFLWLLLSLSIYNSFAQSLLPIPEAVQQAQHSVYKIKLKDRLENGTGFFISSHLFVINFHGVGSLNLESENFEEIELYQQNTLSPIKIKRLVGVSALFDLAILETETPVNSYLDINTKAPSSNTNLFTIGYPQGTLIIQQKTGNLLSWKHNYCFLSSQYPAANSNGSSGSPVLNEKGEVVGIIHAGISNLLNSINPDKIKQLITNEIGTGCTHFDNIKSCVESEMDSMENEMQEGNAFAQYFGSFQQNMYYKSRFLNDMTQSFNDMTVEEQEQFLTKVKNEVYNEFKTLDEQALHWNTLSAQQGYAPAQYALGLSHYYKEHMKPDPAQAFHWMEQSAKQNYAPAQYMLSIFYYNGEGTPKDIRQFTNWLIRSANQSYMLAQLDLADAYLAGDGVEKIPSRSFYWYKKSAQEGSTEAQLSLGISYINGDGVRRDWNRGLYWIKQSAEQNYPDAQRELATLYYNGDGIERNVEQAFYWTKKAAEGGDLESQFRLFMLYHNGDGVTQDIEVAHQWLYLAAEGGHEVAQAELEVHFKPDEPSFIDQIKGLFSD